MLDVHGWLDKFGAALKAGDGAAVAGLFLPAGLWRDYLTLGWTLATHEGTDAIAAFVNARVPGSGIGALASDAAPGASEGFINFETAMGRGEGYVRLVGEQCFTLLTALKELKGFEEPLRGRRHSGVVDETGQRTWEDVRHDDVEQWNEANPPYVLVIGAGQGGLALGARLKMLGVPCLLIDKYPRVGDQWRSRYKSLLLHDPVWYDHMPYVPFPDHWPVYTPKQKMGDWLEYYAGIMELGVWTSTECKGIARDPASGKWRVELQRDGKPVTLCPEHVVMAVGNAGFAVEPDFPGKDTFRGHQCHSSAHPGGEGLAGQRVIVVGANNSAHDICADLVSHGAEPVMIQRSSTLIVRQSTMEKMLGGAYSQEVFDAGLTTDKADLLGASVPFRLSEKVNKAAWDQIQIEEAPFYQRLTDAGFAIDFGPDGTGIAMKFQRTSSGYYVDVGASEMVADGRIKVRSGVGIDRIVEDGMVLSDGSHVAGDRIIYATGFGDMQQWVSRLINPEVAKRIGKTWGYGSGFPGDDGPWEGEMKNLWKPTAEPGLWFMAGNLAMARSYSQYLGLQLKARFEGLPVEPYAPG